MYADALAVIGFFLVLWVAAQVATEVIAPKKG